MLNEEQGQLLLSLARKSIKNYFKGKKTTIPDKEFLKEKRGVFVTIETGKGRLKGCIGNPSPSQNLGEAVVKNAVNAAIKDPRFPHLMEYELENVIIEVSVLTKPEKTIYGKIKKGDGVIIDIGGRTALFLPQVWDKISEKEEFMKQLCLKAFLPPEAYKRKEAVVKKFSVQAFKEK